MIYNPKDINNEMMFKEDLVAYIDENENIIILKNRYTGKVGQVSLREYLDIETKREDKDENKDSFDFISSLFDNISATTQDAFSYMEEQSTDVKDSISETFSNTVDSLKNEITTASSRVQDIINPKIDDVAEFVKLRAELMELKILKDSAKRLGVDTKSFLKKVDDRIDDIEDMLFGW